MKSSISNDLFDLEFDMSTGSINRLVKPEEQMNWVINTTENSWHTPTFNWGLGFFRDGSNTQPLKHWCYPHNISCHGNQMQVSYLCGRCRINVKRFFDDIGNLNETYTFTNMSDSPLQLKDIGIYAPFNDNYPNAKTCLDGRCHAHIWAGSHISYVNAMRMSGSSPHLGMIITEGELSGYSIMNRSILLAGSNARGDIVLNPQDMELMPGDSKYIKCFFFWHNGWDDFFQKACETCGFIKLCAEQYTVNLGDYLNLIITNCNNIESVEITINGQSVPSVYDGESLYVHYHTKELGEHDCQVTVGERTTRLRAFVTLHPDELIYRRVTFIADKQQISLTGSVLDGAFLIYDNEDEALHCLPNINDHNAARERIGMGVLLAIWLQSNDNANIKKSLMRYYAYVCSQLQDASFNVLNGPEDHIERLYNYPWVCQLHLEMYHLTKKMICLDNFVATTKMLFAKAVSKKNGFYPIGIPLLDAMTTLRKTSRHDEASCLLCGIRNLADIMIKNGKYYPEHEVNYEQSIVAPSVIFLLETYMLTSEQIYFDTAKEQLLLLEMFNGRQPDHHLHEISIRHWDDYWFGKRQMWGDTFPHHWSVLTAFAFYRYYQITSDMSYYNRAIEIVRNNLSLFKPDGRASCAYIYPKIVNGEFAQLYDPYANEQDWALVYYLMINNDCNRLLNKEVITLRGAE